MKYFHDYHITDSKNISYVNLTFKVIRGHWKSNLGNQRSNLNDNTQSGSFLECISLRPQ